MVGLWSYHLCDNLYLISPIQHFFLGNCRDHYDIYRNLWNADRKKENRERMGLCICFLLYLECYIISRLTDG